jgi:hypothetical protein
MEQRVPCVMNVQLSLPAIRRKNILHVLWLLTQELAG